MAYTYKPIHYSSFQETITTICKSMLPTSIKNRLLPAVQKHARQTAGLKWQQESFHRILNLIGLHNEGIVPESEVLAYRSHLLSTLIDSPTETELPTAIRDKLLFLQDLLYAKCISLEEYHSSKKPLLQRLAAHGAEIDFRDVIVEAPKLLKDSKEEWSDIDLNDESPKADEKKANEKSSLKYFWKGKVKKEESSLKERQGSGERQRCKRKPLHGLFPKELPEETGIGKNQAHDCKDRREKFHKKLWSIENLKKWKRSSHDDDSMKPYFLPGERFDDASYSNHCKLVSSPIGEGPDTKRIKKQIHSGGSSSDFFIDKVLGENIKKELTRIQTELSATNQNLNFSSEQIEAISMKLPVDKADLNKFFPKSWCNAYGDIFLDVVKKEFKDHVGEMESLKYAPAKGEWVAFKEEDDENFHPHLFSEVKSSSNQHGVKDSENFSANYANYNPFLPPKWEAFKEEDNENFHPNLYSNQHGVKDSEDFSAKNNVNYNPFLPSKWDN